MPRKPLVDDDTDYEPPAAVQTEAPAPRRKPLAEPPAPNYDGEQGEHPAGRIDRIQEEISAARAAAADPPTSRLRRGWSAANSQVEKNSDYAQAFKPDENVTYVIKFLEEDPYVTFNRHWIERPSQKGGKVNIPITCLRSEGINQKCPLCDVLGDAPKSVTSFNIAVVESDGSVGLKSFDCTAKTMKTIQNFSREQTYKPITKRWWTVRKVKDSRGFNEYQITPIMSDRSLQEDYDYTVPSDVDLKALDVYEPDIVQIRPASELMEIAKEMQAQSDDSYDPY